MSKKMTITIEFPDDQYGEYASRRFLNSDAAYSSLWDIAQEVFRPARKHGYPDSDIQLKLDQAGEAGVELVRLLEQKFYAILVDHKVDLDDWQ